ncbi:hypothetical protein NG895_29600 [Aeoliella sp. ICT_H6.2]|uniref:Uncharacterized protein n=1 Tax=Aeoliella straminimaris TaxID=2954799 RepID=A0A9X2FF78_9BACT|nr:hypothetical protein [Aeoliella straminimaris]MCO6048077.1 hypothetical protein [Aeoliella straminimaris]
MSKDHKHAGKHGHADHNQHQHHNRRPGPHKDWRVWTAVVLMLGAMVAYVMSMDESEVPGEPPQPAMDGLDAE